MPYFLRDAVRLCLLLVLACTANAAAAPSGERTSVYFSDGSAVLTAEALATVGENADRLKGDRTMAVTLVGYADDLGSTSYSVALAHRRAATVAKALVDMGVLPRQIRAVGYGQEEMAAPCPTGDCRIGYHRVEFRYPTPSRLEADPAATADRPAAHR